MWAFQAIWLERFCSGGCAQRGGGVPRFLVVRLAAALGMAGLAGCGGPSDIIGVGAAAGATVASVAVLGRSPPDALYSLATGRDCSIVRWDEGKSYCRPVEPPPEPAPFCTRSLGAVNCWTNPAALPGRPKQLADTPAVTAEQEAYRVRRWPWW